MLTAGADKTAKIWDIDLVQVYGPELRERICAEKLIGAQEFTTEELANPILRGIDADDPIARNPCLRRGPLSPEYWTRLPGQLARWWGWRGTAGAAKVRTGDIPDRLDRQHS